MSEFRRIIMSSFLMLLLHFPAADVKDNFRIVRVGDEVTLPCDNVKYYQDNCKNTTWLFSGLRSSAAVTLFEYGKTHTDAKANSDRLRVEKNGSLVIKNVTEENAGRYDCQQYNKSGDKQGSGSYVCLSVVTITEHQDNDEVTLRCSVKTYGGCEHTVKWLLLAQDVLGANVQTFRPQSSGEDAGKVTTVSPTWTTVNIRPAGETTNTASEDNQTEQEANNKGWWWWIIVVIVGVAALTIITVAVIRRKRTQGTDTQTDDNVADPEDGVSYASISYTRKTSRAHLHDDDEDDAVTYSTVRAPSSSSAASADPSLLYATVNKPRKKPM
ncbi:Neuroglian [Dissostichus eleginoides]|uniref:Neuroglian n=1 Tax=Dissostichus eleginoides TaxID=100907 RepID=A0AAD9BV39_DISEL|nr:Neuroglian [Dissostichus eleginoides]